MEVHHLPTRLTHDSNKTPTGLLYLLQERASENRATKLPLFEVTRELPYTGLLTRVWAILLTARCL